MRKKLVAVILSAIMALGAFVGCSKASDDNDTTSSEKSQDTSSKSGYSRNYIAETLSNFLSEEIEDNSVNESSIDYISSKDYEMKIETSIKGLQFEIPKDWEKDVDGLSIYYYPQKNNSDFMFFVGKENFASKLSINDYLTEFGNEIEKNSRVKKLISKENLTIKNNPCLYVVFQTEMNEQDYVICSYHLINNNYFYSFSNTYLKSNDNKYKNVFDNLIDSITFVSENSEVESSKEESLNSETSKEDSSNSVNKSTNKIIYDKNNVKISYKGIEDKGYRKDIKLYIENNLSYDVMIQDRDFSINGYMFLSTHLSPTITSGKKINEDISIYSYELEENDIDEIKDIEMKLLIVDKNDYSKKIETETIKFSVS